MGIDKKSLRTLLLYEFKCGRSPQQAAENINRTESCQAIGARTVKRWFDKFSAGDTSLTDKKRPGRPVTVSKEKLEELIEKTPSATCKYLANELGVCRSTVQKQLKELGKRKNSNEWRHFSN
ncbi:hypothetical protein NEMIN01_0538 [Nematocida minor]|uniref:uncharacterized protein n=1 Tax=Nematocida minor TaxID=1912983 RepID=UPI002220D6D5|nr:uncharacterized protein NEMIN01_0538 [Nematocida minor]KAI5189475.1 hypothetical protein NEMIN01_0538 [Nematocida minor]